MAETPQVPQNPFHPLSGGGQNRLLKFSVNCPVCEQPYDLQGLRIIGESDQSLLTHIDCGNCGTAVLTLIAMKQGGVVALRMITDLTPEEVPLLDEHGIHEDEVLDFYMMLERDDITPQHLIV